MNKFLKTSLALSLLVLPAAAWGAGFAIWEMGTQSSAMGGTMTAWPDDPTAIFYNPAGLASLGSDQLAINVSGIKVNTEFSGVAPNPGYGVQERLADAFHIVPQIYYSKALRKDLALGIGVCSPYGLAVEWDDPETYSGRAIATYTDLKTYFVMPTIAWKPSCKFMVGAGMNIVKGSVTLEQTIVQGLPNPVDAGTVSIEGSSDLTYSFNLGLLARPHKLVALGLSYKSQTDLDFTGDATFEAYEGYESVIPADGGVSTAMSMPSLISVGVSGWVTQKLRAEFDYNYVMWSCFETLDLEFEDTPELNKSIPEDYEDVSQYRLGLEYHHCEATTYRAGFVYDETPQPSSTTGPVLPDANRTGFSFGMGWKATDAVTLDWYWLLLFNEDREIRDNHDNYNGDYHTYTDLIGVGLTYKF